MVKKFTPKKPKNVEEATIYYLKDNPNWNMWPWLPLKKSGSCSIDDKTLGALYYSTFHKIKDDKLIIRIFHINIYHPPATLEDLEASPQTHYNTIEELLAAGWVVD